MDATDMYDGTTLNENSQTAGHSSDQQAYTPPSCDAPVPDYIGVLHKGYEPTATLVITADGKTFRFKLNRRQMMTTQAQIWTAFADMEPGPWRRAHEEAA